MAKTKTGKRVQFVVEVYWRGKRKKPSVGIWERTGDIEGFGLPDEYPEFDAFHKAARDLCKVLVEAGELD